MRAITGLLLVGVLLGAASASAAPGSSGPSAGAPAASESVRWFQSTEQALMDAVAPGDKTPWEKITDPTFVATSEEGEVIPREAFLKEIRPLPAGLAGHIAVKELTVDEHPTFAIVRYLADEDEQVFNQKLTTKYRTTDTFRRDGTSWKLVATHTSVVTADPAPLPVPAARLAGLVGEYKISPEGWTMTVEVRDGKLFGGRDPKKLRPFVPLTPTAFVLTGSLGEWLFDVDDTGKAQRIVDFRKFEPLIWTRTK